MHFNTIKVSDKLILSAKSTSNIEFSGNTIETNQKIEYGVLVKLQDCTKVKVKNNQKNVTR